MGDAMQSHPQPDHGQGLAPQIPAVKQSTGPTAIRRKLVCVGDGACGKTSLLTVFSRGEFPTHYEPTIFENYPAEVVLDGKDILLGLWDTAGQEEYERLRPLSYANANVILIAFALDSVDSLDNVLSKWNEEVREICGQNIPVILVGCKKDIRDSETDPEVLARAFVSTEQGERVSEVIGAKRYLECSAKANDNVDAVFEMATRQAMLNHVDECLASSSTRLDSQRQGRGLCGANCCVVS